MSTTSTATRDLARRLIALEATRVESPGASGQRVERVCDKLRVPLIKLAGVTGFRSLLSRALALARAEVPSLDSVRVRDDGGLEGFDAAESDPNEGAAGRAEVVVVAQLLHLLVTFIGEPLTLQLVYDTWSQASLSELGAGSENE
jgi:hypothetical protein